MTNWGGVCSDQVDQQLVSTCLSPSQLVCFLCIHEHEANWFSLRHVNILVYDNNVLLGGAEVNSPQLTLMSGYYCL